MNSSVIKNLDGIKSGVYKVDTATSQYLFDFENLKAKRAPAEDAIGLEGDGDWFKFLTVTCSIGERMVIWCIDKSDHFNYRYSTEVVGIEKVTTY